MKSSRPACHRCGMTNTVNALGFCVNCHAGQTRKALVLLLSALAACAAPRTYTFRVDEPITLRVVDKPEFRKAYGPGPHYHDDGRLWTNGEGLPPCFFNHETREIFIDSWTRPGECVLHELCHAAGLSDDACDKIK